jgi:hypothetical protein
MDSKRFIVQSSKEDLPHWFLNQHISTRYISVVSCHLSINGVLEKGYILESNIAHSEPYIDGFICYINEFFTSKRYLYSDSQLRTINVFLKNKDDNAIDLEEIVDTNGDTVDIPIEAFDPSIHKFKYHLRLELMLEVMEKYLMRTRWFQLDVLFAEWLRESTTAIFVP